MEDKSLEQSQRRRTTGLHHRSGQAIQITESIIDEDLDLDFLTSQLWKLVFIGSIASAICIETMININAYETLDPTPEWREPKMKVCLQLILSLKGSYKQVKGVT